MEICSCIILLTLLLIQSSFASINQRVVLIVGNLIYTNLGSLDNTINDARSIEKNLKEIGFKRKMVTDTDELSLLKAIKKFSSVTITSSISLIFYAWHGAQIDG